MQFSIAAGLLGLAQYAVAVPVTESRAPLTAANVSASTSSPIATNSPVAAADTPRTIISLGIEPSVLSIPVTPNPNFVKNVTNALAVAQAKYVVTESNFQREKRALEEFQALEKRGRVPLTTAAAARVPLTEATGAAAAAATTPALNLPCSLFPYYCKSTTKTTSAKATTSSSTKTSSTSTTSAKPTTTSVKATTTSSKASTTLSALSLAATDIQLDSEYLSTIEIGSNKNALQLVMDTGSADLWMFSTDCVGCTTNHDFYNPSLSTTFTNTTTTFSLLYGDGSTTSGYLGFDTVTIAGAPIQAQSIDVPHVISASLQSNTMDGILGLGFPSLMDVQDAAGVTTPVTAMANQGLIPSAKFGVQLIKDTHWTYGGGGGTWTFGGIDSSVISGSINYIPLTQAKYWMIPLQSVAIGTVYSAVPSINHVIVDSGTTLILLEASTVAAIHTHLPGGRISPDNSHYQIFCNASDSAYTGSQNAYITLGGVKYGIPASDLAWYPEDSSYKYCYSGIQGWSNSFGILGAMFLKNVYGVFDQTNQQIGFASRTDVAAVSG